MPEEIKAYRVRRRKQYPMPDGTYRVESIKVKRVKRGKFEVHFRVLDGKYKGDKIVASIRRTRSKP